MRSYRCALVAALLVSSRAPGVLAHDFWVQPAGFWLRPDAVTSMTLQVGHGPFRQRSPIALRRITRFQAIGPRGTLLELHDHLRLGERTEDGDFHFSTPGSYMLVLQTDDHAQTHLPPIRFNDYLRTEGLTPALKQRSRLHRMDADGSESYSRSAKSLVQVGPPDAGSEAQITKPIGLPLEIVPGVNPYSTPRPATLPIQVFYEGHPLAGALVKFTDLGFDSAPFEAHLTDPGGRAIFTMPSSGSWLLNVIWTKPLPRSAETDFETAFSSLSFGFPAGPPQAEGSIDHRGPAPRPR